MADEEVKTEEEIIIKDAPEKAEAPDSYANDEITPDVGIEALKIQLEQERMARADAEGRARAASEHAARAGAEARRARPRAEGDRPRALRAGSLLQAGWRLGHCP